MHQGKRDEVVRLLNPALHNLALLEMETTNPPYLLPILQKQRSYASTDLDKLFTCVTDRRLDLLNILRWSRLQPTLADLAHEVHALRVFPTTSEFSWHSSYLRQGV